MRKISPPKTQRSTNAGSSLSILRSKSVLTLKEAASLMLGRIGLRYKASPELKNAVQRMRDASDGDLPLIPHPWRVTRAALNEWANAPADTIDLRSGCRYAEPVQFLVAALASSVVSCKDSSDITYRSLRAQPTAIEHYVESRVVTTSVRFWPRTA